MNNQIPELISLLSDKTRADEVRSAIEATKQALNQKATVAVIGMQNSIFQDNKLSEEVLSEAMRIIVRGGKVIRKRLIKKRPGFKIQDGRLVRQSPAEHRRRSIAAKRSARKLVGKRNQINRKRRLSLKKRSQIVHKQKKFK